jgi:transcriptional regulator with XRE-family HTH domain
MALTPEELKLRMAELDVTLVTMASAFGYTRQQVSRWLNGRAPIPSWVPYALGMATLGAMPVAAPDKPADAPKPVPEPTVAKPVIAPLVIPATPKDDGRPFKYIGGRKVYLD